MKSSFKEEFKKVFKIAKWEYILKFFTSIMIRGILLVIPVLFSYAINCVTKNDTDNAILLIIISIFITAIYRFFEGFNQYAYYKLYNKIFSHYNELALRKTNNNSLFSLSRFNLGQYTNIVIADVDIISGFFTAGVIRVVQTVEFLVIFVYFFSIDLLIFISTILISLLMLYISIKSGKKVQALNEKRKLELDGMTSSTHEYFNGIKEIKSYNLFERIYPTSENSTNDYLKANAKYNVKFNCNNHAILYVFELFRLLSVLYGIYLVTDGNMEIGMLLIIYNYYQKIIDNFSTILTINVEFRNLKVSLLRFNKLIEYSHDKKDGMKINQNNVEGKIVFKDVLYGFKTNPTLDETSFEINPNSITVITGKDESAQNGVFDLLLKLNKQHEGSISIDNYEINNIEDESYFKLISCARKQTFLFDVSIKDNLLMVEDDLERIKEICKKVGVDDDIEKLENGYDTIIKNNTPISESTKDLLIMSRMLLKNSKILLFDRSINDLDKETQKKIIKIFEDLRTDHTILLICHEQEIIDMADKVIEFVNKKAKVISKK